VGHVAIFLAPLARTSIFSWCGRLLPQPGHIIEQILALDAEILLEDSQSLRARSTTVAQQRGLRAVPTHLVTGTRTAGIVRPAVFAAASFKTSRIGLANDLLALITKHRESLRI